MKKKIFFVFILGLLLGVRAFAQCVVSGGNLKEDLNYNNIEEMQNDIKNIKKAANKDGMSFAVIIPKKSVFRNTFNLKKLATDVFDSSEVNFDDYDADCFVYSNIITLFIVRRSKSDYCITKAKGLMTKAEVAKILEKEQAKREAEEAERNKILEQINNIKEESEKSFREKEILRCKELGYTETTFNSAAEQFAKNKEFILALKAYYERIVLESQELQIYNIQVQDMFRKTKRVYTNWNDTYSKIQPSYWDYKFYTLMDVVSNGNPWTYEYDDSSRYEDWKILIKECEQYFLENPVFSIYYTNLKKYTENVENNSYVYVCDFETGEFEPDGYSFYNYIVNNISFGLKKVWKDSWTEIPKDWIKTTPVGRMDYEIKCNIVDKTGKVLFEGNRVFIASAQYNSKNYMEKGGGVRFQQFNKSIEFKDVPKSVATLIEDGKAYVRLDSLYLKYDPSEEKAEKIIPKNKVSEYNRTKVFNKAKGEFENIDVKF